MMIDIAGRLAHLGLVLPPAPSPRGDYVSAVIHNGIAYVSGQVSRVGDQVIAGPANHDTSPDVLRHAARTCVLRALSALSATLPVNMAVERVLFLRGFVNAVPDFTNHSRVMDEASSLLHQIFGESGRHARSALGVSSLPDAGLLEIELIVALTQASAPAPRPSPQECADDSSSAGPRLIGKP